MKQFLSIFAFFFVFQRIICCSDSITTASGPFAPARICSGELIFEENFDKFDLDLWNHEVSLYGGYNGEFQWYTNHRDNTFAQDGKLFVMPTLTYKYLPCNCPESLTSYTLDLLKEEPFVCTNADREGCFMQGTSEEIINPVRSGRIKTDNGFRFKYGKVEVRAKVPRGPFLWPAVWMMPAESVYGGWPNSGEIDIMESRGNKQILTKNGEEIGNRRALQTLHFGNGWQHHEYRETNNLNDEEFGKDFHLFKLEWTPEHIKFQTDDFPERILNSPFQGNYTGSENEIAPFDQEFYFIINLAVGGTHGYFPDDAEYAPELKPYRNDDGRRVGQTKYWNANTWKGIEKDPEGSSLQVDYIKVWAL
ncbi:beta-1,3-glucan-binding protein-like [Culicoides brevitarsis]|uniref:beta-1,3-glucan-binding protein-like n=1 Tax=Culicoides brevitarsis TaxID=469753 RepID=UPI00307C8A0E